VLLRFEPNRHYIAYTDIGYARSTDAGKTWYWQTGRPLRNTTYELAFDPVTPGKIWAAFADLHDIPNNWEWINGSHSLLWPKDYDVDPRDSRVIYLGAADASNEQGGLYKTSDGGATWSRIARKGPECFGATVHPRKPDWLYLCLTEDAPGSGLWLSKDAGKSWKALDGLPFRNAQRIAFDPRDDSVIYVSTFGASVWRGPADY